MSDGDFPKPRAAEASGDLPDLCRLAVARFRLIALCAVGFAVVAVIVTAVRGPRFEASAFLEIDRLDEVPTVEERLRFPSLYLRVAEGDAEAARSLRLQTRVKAARGSRLVAVTVESPDAEIAAREANAIADAFLHPEEGGEKSAELSLESLPAPDAADSPRSLAEAWKTQSAEFAKLSARYENDGEHPAVKGAAERLEKLRDRILTQLAEWRRRIGFEAVDPEVELDLQLDDLLARIERARSLPIQGGIPTLVPGGVRLAEPASPALEPVGPSPVLVVLGALVLGAFVGFLAALCGCCERRKS